MRSSGAQVELASQAFFIGISSPPPPTEGGLAPWPSTPSGARGAPLRFAPLGDGLTPALALSLAGAKAHFAPASNHFGAKRARGREVNYMTINQVAAFAK